MEKSSMTALVSAFSRAYHYKNNRVRIFDDSMAEYFLTDQEYQQIFTHMAQGIGFFNPGFTGSEQEALRWVVDNQLSPSPLARAAFAEKSLENAVRIGAEQYLILAAGFDTFAYRQPAYAGKLEIFEIDHPLTGADKDARAQKLSLPPITNLHRIPADFSAPDWQQGLLACPTFNRNAISFCSLLGISYYLSQDDFKRLLLTISEFVPEGSAVAFDYPDQYAFTSLAGERSKKQAAMASAAGEPMQVGYCYDDLEGLLSECGLLIYEHLEPKEITHRFFTEYNLHNPHHRMTASENVNYCLAVKKG